MRRIVCAANKHSKTGKILLGIRHWDTQMHSQLESWNEAWMVENCKLSHKEFVQGFIDNKGDFWDREQALKIATKANQLIRKTDPEDELFSEDLY